jgi:hypothetical protein
MLLNKTLLYHTFQNTTQNPKDIRVGILKRTTNSTIYIRISLYVQQDSSMNERIRFQLE